MTTGEWSCLISFAWDTLSCSEQAGIDYMNTNGQCMYGIGYDLIANANLCNQLLY